MSVQVTVKDHGAKRARELLKKPRLNLKVGVLQNEAQQVHPSGNTIGQIAWWMEVGFHANGKWVEPRSWIRDWLDENYKKIQKQLAADTVRVIYGKPPESEKKALSKRGAVYKRDVQIRIRNVPGNWKKLEDSTIAKKGHAAPLIDTTTLINAIRYEVVP